jgi:fructose-1,6-bisphosphatase/inositol monophosphatase family enzyme
MEYNAIKDILDSMENIHQAIRKAVRKSIKDQAEELTGIFGSGNGDVSYGIDVVCEDIIDKWFTDNPPAGGAVVICEGLGQRVYPNIQSKADARWQIIIDPLDGTRHIMYDIRSAWILTGIAENKGSQVGLNDICAAIQTEVPITVQDKGAVLKAVKYQGAELKIYDLNTDKETDTHMLLARSTATNLENGFCVFSNFFAGTKTIISKLEERVLCRLYGHPTENSALVFSEQYISSAGQLFMLMTGKYRMVADIRALLNNYQKKRDLFLPLCVHPYDLSTSLIAIESGCIVKNVYGDNLDYPLNLNTNCAWMGYANSSLYKSIHPIVIKELKALCIL